MRDFRAAGVWSVYSGREDLAYAEALSVGLPLAEDVVVNPDLNPLRIDSRDRQIGESFLISSQLSVLTVLPNKFWRPTEEDKQTLVREGLFVSPVHSLNDDVISAALGICACA